MRFKKTLIGAVLATAALTAAYAHGGRGGDGGFFGMEGGRHGMQHGPGGMGMDPARAGARIERMVSRAVWEIGGTTEQRDRITAIAKAAMTDVSALHKQRADLRSQGLALLKAPSVDRGAIEKLRADQIGLADAASKRITQAMADAAEVLTPEQRVKLAERMESHRRGGRGEHGPGMRHGQPGEGGQPGAPAAPAPRG